MGQSEHEIFPCASSRPSTQQVFLGTMSQLLKGQASLSQFLSTWNVTLWLSLAPVSSSWVKAATPISDHTVDLANKFPSCFPHSFLEYSFCVCSTNLLVKTWSMIIIYVYIYIYIIKGQNWAQPLFRIRQGDPLLNSETRVHHIRVITKDSKS